MNKWTIIYYTADTSICPHIHGSFYKKSNPSANILHADGREYLLPNSTYRVKDINSSSKPNVKERALKDSRKDKLRHKLVRNNDKFLRDWIKDNYHTITTNNVAFFEWDVLLNKQLPDINIRNMKAWNATSVRNAKKWQWLKEILEHEKNVNTTVCPFAGFYLSKNFIKQMISSKYDYLYELDIFCEARLSILAHLIEAKPETDREIFNQKNPLEKPESLKLQYKNIDEVPTGCFHPIKENILI